MTPENTKWGDERLDDLAAQVRLLASMPVQMAVFSEKLEGFGDDTREMRRQIEQLTRDLRERETKAQDQRKRDRALAWSGIAVVLAAVITTIGTVLTQL